MSNFSKCKKFDVGGLTTDYSAILPHTEVLIFVVDASDKEQIEEAREKLLELLSLKELQEANLLVYVNKQDLPKAEPVYVICEALKLNRLRQRKWFIQDCCAVTGEGLIEGWEWINSNTEAMKGHTLFRLDLHIEYSCTHWKDWAEQFIHVDDDV